MKIIRVTAKGHGGSPVWYDRKTRKSGCRTRQYHAFGLARVVSGSGESFWRLVIGKWTFAFGYENRREVRK